MNELLAEAQRRPELDPQGSLVDADMGAYYTWLNQQRLSGAEQATFLVWFEDHAEAVAIGPGFDGGRPFGGADRTSGPGREGVQGRLVRASRYVPYGIVCTGPGSGSPHPPRWRSPMMNWGMTPASAIHPVLIHLSGKRIVRVLSWIVVFFGAAHMTGSALMEIIGREHIHRLGLTVVFDQFNLNEETNLPTYYSSFLLGFGGALLLLTSRMVRQTGGPMVGRWRVLGFGFLAMSFDEFGSIHEKIGSFITLHFRAPQHGVLHFNWLIFGLPFVGVLGAIFLPFVLRLAAPLRNSLILAGCIYVGAAVGLEMIGSWYSDRFGEENLGYATEVLVEETMEMTGVILMIRCLLKT